VIYLIRVGGLLHHGTSRLAEHEAYAAKLTAAGHAVTVLHEPFHMGRNSANLNASESPASAANTPGPWTTS
jgi:hypothetical protein